MTLDQLADFCRFDEGRIDLAGKLVRDRDGDAVYNFGPKKGSKVRDEIGLAYWMLDKDFTANTKRCVQEEINRIRQSEASEQSARPLPAGGDVPF